MNNNNLVYDVFDTPYLQFKINQLDNGQFAAEIVYSDNTPVACEIFSSYSDARNALILAMTTI